MRSRKTVLSKGFTIVELLVVIVVIGVLATITVIGYVGVTQRAAAATLQTDLKSASTQLEIYKAENDRYPTSGSGAVTNLPKSDGTAYEYTVSSNGSTYTLTGTTTANSTVVYHVSSSTGGSILAGPAFLTWKQIAAPGSASCGVASNNYAYCWGYNAIGTVGDGTTVTPKTAPVAVNTSGLLSGKTIKSVGTGSNFSCALASDDKVYCWGLNDVSGYLGNNSTAQSLVPVAVDTSGVLSGKTVKSLSVGGYTTCVIASDDNAYCWGSSTSGALGNGSTTYSRVPVAVTTSGVLSGKTIKSITVGESSHACVIASDNNAYCWGENSAGTLGNNSTTNSSVPVAVTTSGVLSGKTIKNISVGGLHTCAVASDDNAYCWGYNGIHGVLGNNSTTNSSVPVAVTTSGVLSGKTIKNIDAGSSVTCLTASDDKAYCWGDNNYGQLGNNTTTFSLVPVAVNTAGVLSGKALTYAYTNGGVSCAISTESKEYCWGYNGWGNFADGTTTNSSVPVAVQPVPAE